jgi:hypothetical protein
MKTKRPLYYDIAAEHSTDLHSIYVLTTEDIRRCAQYASSIPDVRMIATPRPDTLTRLWRFLHECAHVKMHQSPAKHMSYHWLELDAERYAYMALHQAGIKIPERRIQESRWHIRYELTADLRAGFKPAPGVFEYLEWGEQKATAYVAHIQSLPQTFAFLRDGPASSWGSREWAAYQCLLSIKLDDEL